MNQNETRTLWLSVGAALFAVFLLYSYTQEKTAELTKKFGSKTNVVIAKVDINEMQTIDETMLQIIEQPVDFIQPNALKNPEVAVGMVAMAPIKKGEQILSTKVLKPGPLTGLSLQISPSKRAITLPIDEIRGVAKLIKPGDHVDIIVAIDIGKGVNIRKEVTTLMSDVLLLATGLKVSNELPRLRETINGKDFITNIREDTSFTNVTIEVSPKQGQDLVYILATNPGALFLTLRHPSDHYPVKSLGRSSSNSILNIPRIAKPKFIPRKPRFTPRPKVLKPRKKKNRRFKEL